VEEKGKRTSLRTRIVIDFDPKTSKLLDQESMDKYMASFGFCSSPGIKNKFCPNDVDVSSALPNKEGVYMHPLMLTLGLGLSMPKLFAMF